MLEKEILDSLQLTNNNESQQLSLNKCTIAIIN